MSSSSRAIVLTALFALSLCSFSQGQSVPNASFFAGGGSPGGTYQLIDDYEPAIFFNKFNFYDVSQKAVMEDDD